MGVKIRYMGAKHNLAPAVADVVEALPEGPFLDLFAGMCSVAGAISPSRRPAWCNDVQVYARLVAEGLVCAKEEPIAGRKLLDVLAPHVDANVRALTDRYGGALRREARALSQEDHRGYKEVVSNWKHCGNDNAVATEVCYLRDRPGSYPYRLVALTFSHGFFGLRQAIELDSLRFALDIAAVREEISLDQYRWGLISLLQVASHVATSPGHFAEFLHVRDDDSFQRIRAQRARVVTDTFVTAVDMIRPYGDATWRSRNRAYNCEAQALTRKLAKRVNRPRVVYADPPYSAAQYSRYYHVLETLVLYDYPESSGAGRYRGDRHQTAFSKLGSVEGAFRDVIRSVAAMDAALVLSYPSNGLLYEVGADPVQLLQDHYKVIEVLSTGTARHSTLGGAPGRAKSCVEEVIYVAKEPA